MKRKLEDPLKPGAAKVKKEKKEKKSSKKSKKQQDDVKPVIKDVTQIKSLTDDLPVEASKLSELRKIVVMQENLNNTSSSNTVEFLDDNFDIPPLSEVRVMFRTWLLFVVEATRFLKMFYSLPNLPFRAKVNLPLQADSFCGEFKKLPTR